MTQRLIEAWLPIAALGEERIRGRRSMTALPPVYYLHVWWARRPLVALRAAILASLLPADADREKFMHVLGIHGDPVASRRRIDEARRKGERFEGEAYTYRRGLPIVRRMTSGSGCAPKLRHLAPRYLLSWIPLQEEGRFRLKQPGSAWKRSPTISTR